MERFYEVLQKKPFGKKCFRHRYEIFHGFCAGRANYEDPENGKLARDVQPLKDPLVCFLFANDVCDRHTRTSVISSLLIWLEMETEEYSL